MYHFCRTFKRDKNSRLLVKTLKRKVLLFSYICSIKKSKQHRGFIYVTRYRSFFITFVLSRHYRLPSRFPARRFPVSKSRFFLSNFPASFCVHRHRCAVTLSLYVYPVKHIRVIRTKRTGMIYSLTSS